MFDFYKTYIFEHTKRDLLTEFKLVSGSNYPFPLPGDSKSTPLPFEELENNNILFCGQNIRSLLISQYLSFKLQFEISVSQILQKLIEIYKTRCCFQERKILVTFGCSMFT